MARQRQMQNTSLKHLRMSQRADIITCNFTTLRSRNWDKNLYKHNNPRLLFMILYSVNRSHLEAKNSNFSCRCCKLSFSDIGFYFFLGSASLCTAKEILLVWLLAHLFGKSVSVLRMSYCKRAKCSIFMVLPSVNMINSPWSVVRVRLIIQRSLSRL